MFEEPTTPDEPTDGGDELSEYEKSFLAKKAPASPDLSDYERSFLSAPKEAASVKPVGWWTQDKIDQSIKHLQKTAKLSHLGATALVARWAGVEATGGPDSVNPKSGAIGIGQWLGPRKKGVPKDHIGQLDYAAKELNGPEAFAAKLLRDAKTPEEAAIGAAAYERAEGYDPKNPLKGDRWVKRTLETMGKIPPMKPHAPEPNPVQDLTDYEKSFLGPKQPEQTDSRDKPLMVPPGTPAAPPHEEDLTNPVYGMTPEQFKAWEADTTTSDYQNFADTNKLDPTKQETVDLFNTLSQAHAAMKEEDSDAAFLAKHKGLAMYLKAHKLSLSKESVAKYNRQITLANTARQKARPSAGTGIHMKNGLVDLARFAPKGGIRTSGPIKGSGSLVRYKGDFGKQVIPERADKFTLPTMTATGREAIRAQFANNATPEGEMSLRKYQEGYRVSKLEGDDDFNASLAGNVAVGTLTAEQADSLVKNKRELYEAAKESVRKEHQGSWLTNLSRALDYGDSLEDVAPTWEPPEAEVQARLAEMTTPEALAKSRDIEQRKNELLQSFDRWGGVEKSSAAFVKPLVTFGAGVARAASNLPLVGSWFNQKYEGLSTEAGALNAALEHANKDSGIAPLLVNKASGVAGDLTLLAGLSKVPGIKTSMPTVFALQSGLSAAGGGAKPWDVAKAFGSGYTIGHVFNLGSAVETMTMKSMAGETLTSPAQKAFWTAVPAQEQAAMIRIMKSGATEAERRTLLLQQVASKFYGGTVLVAGTAATQGLFNEPFSADQIATNLLFHFGGQAYHVAKGGAKAVAGRVSRVWKDGKPNDYFLNDKNQVEKIVEPVDQGLVETETVADPKNPVYSEPFAATHFDPEGRPVKIKGTKVTWEDGTERTVKKADIKRDFKVKESEAPLPEESPFKSEDLVMTPEGPGKVLNSHLSTDGQVFVQLEGDKGISLFKPEVLKPHEVSEQTAPEVATENVPPAETIAPETEVDPITRALTTPEENAQKVEEVKIAKAEESANLATNGSGESAASQEAINRTASESAQGISRVVVDTRKPNAEPRLITDVDYNPQPYESVEFRGGDRNGEVIAQGVKVGPAYSPPARIEPEVLPPDKPAEAPTTGAEFPQEAIDAWKEYHKWRSKPRGNSPAAETRRQNSEYAAFQKAVAALGGEWNLDLSHKLDLAAGIKRPTWEDADMLGIPSTPTSTEQPVAEPFADSAKALEPTGVDKNGQPKSVVHVKGEDGDYPVHRVTINGEDRFIQRMDTQDLGTNWHEVVPTESGSWIHPDSYNPNMTASLIANRLGSTKAEAIHALVNNPKPEVHPTPKQRAAAEQVTEPTQVASEDIVTSSTQPENVSTKGENVDTSTEVPSVSSEFTEGDPVYIDGKTQADVAGEPYTNKKGELMVPVRNPLTGETSVVKASRLHGDEAGFASLDMLTAPAQKILGGIRSVKEFLTGPMAKLYEAGVGLPAIVHAYARISTPFQVRDLLSQVFPDSYMNPERMAETIRIINLDNILDGYYTYRQRSQDALTTAAGFTRRQTDERRLSVAEAQKWQAKAEAINTQYPIAELVDELLAARDNPEIMANIERWRDIVNPKIDTLYKQVKGLEEDAEVSGRGHLFGARINLLPDFREAEMKAFGDLSKPTPGSSYVNYKNPLGARDQHDRAASFTGTYSTDPQAVLTNVLGPRLNVASRLNLYQSLVDKGQAVYGDKPPLINGREPVPLDIRLPETSGPQNRTKLKFERMWVDPRIHSALRQVLNTDQRAQQVPLLRYINAFQVMQLVDLVAHLKNVHTVLAYSPKTGSELANAALRLPGVGTIDTIHRISSTIKEVVADTPEVRAKMATMVTNGMLRPDYPATGVQKWTGATKLIHQVDTASRMIMADFFDKQVEAGNVKTTGTRGTPEYDTALMEAKRNFVQQIGEYNDRLMGKGMATLKGWGVSPFVVAGTTFNKMAVKMLTGSPGFEASSTATAAQLRAVNMISGPVAAAVIPAMLNLATTGSLQGRPGTPIGSWDYGADEDDKGKHPVLDLLQLGGYRRGLRVTGLNAVMAGLQSGSDADEIIGNAFEDSKNSLSHPWIGPAPGFVFRALTGKKLDMRSGEDWQGPRNMQTSTGQFLENLRVAVRDTNPFVYSIASTIPGVNSYTATPYEREPLNLKIWGYTVPEPIAKIGSGLGKAPLASGGFTEVKTPATRLMDDIAASKGSMDVDPSNEASRAEAAKLLVQARTGTPSQDIQDQLTTAVNNGSIKLSQVAKLQDNLMLSPTAVKFKYLIIDNVPQIIQVWERMTPKEKEQSWGVMLGKVANLVTAGKVSENDAASLGSIGIDQNAFDVLQKAGEAKQDKALDKFNAEQAIKAGQTPDLSGMTKPEMKKMITTGALTQDQQDFAGKTPAQQLFIFANSPADKQKEYYQAFIKSLQTLSKKSGKTAADVAVLQQMAKAAADYKP